jgi:hypothetical protein
MAWNNERIILNPGDRFGDLTVIGEASSIIQSNGKRGFCNLTAYEVECGLCKSRIIVPARSLKSGNSTKCGKCQRRLRTEKAQRVKKEVGWLVGLKSGRGGSLTLAETKHIRGIEQ